MRPVVLYRPYDDNLEDGEIATISKYFPVTRYRTDIRSGDIVIGRYSLLPFYREQEEDFLHIGASTINTYLQHCYIANISNWYSDLQDLTPKTWNSLRDIDEDGPYVLKGETNSRRQKWKTHMFAETLEDAKHVFINLMNDDMISSQGVVFRKYEHLASYGQQVNGLPISDEYRFFICDGQVLGGGFYWSSCVEDIGFVPSPSSVPTEFLDEVIRRIGNSARFYAVDVAKTIDDRWIVIELNDGSMSGLSMCDPDQVFGSLARVLGA